jgi:hypothetical protein
LRFLDLAAAGLIAITSIAVLFAWSPQAPDLAARRDLDEAHLTDLLVSLVQEEGLVTLTSDSPAAFCGLLLSQSNATVSFSGSSDGIQCSPSPPPGAATSNITAAVGQKVVVLENWYGAGA